MTETVRDGNWLDDDGCCKVCDGEIPHGHTDNCDIYKLERTCAALEAQVDRLMLEYCPDEMTDAQRQKWARHQRPVLP